MSALRGHMHGVHGLDTAGMLPLRVLLHLHEQDHADHEGEWGGSTDMSRSPGFVARRR